MVLRGSTVNYVLTDDEGRNRWGDYNSASLDPDNSVWVKTKEPPAQAGWGSRGGRWGYPKGGIFFSFFGSKSANVFELLLQNRDRLVRRISFRPANPVDTSYP